MIQCNQQNCFTLCEPCTVNDSTYHLTTKTIFFLDSRCHCYIKKREDGFCDTCRGICKKNCTYFDQFGSTSRCKNEIKHSTVSPYPIPATLDESMIQVYNRKLSNGIELPHNIFPEAECCVNGYPFNEHNVLEQTEITVYTKNDILKLNEHG